MIDPALKAKYETMKIMYDSLQERLRVLQSEAFDIGVELGVLAEKLSEDGMAPKTFDGQVKQAAKNIKPRNPFDPIKMRRVTMTPITPHPIDAKAVIDSEGSWGGD